MVGRSDRQRARSRPFAREGRCVGHPERGRGPLGAPDLTRVARATLYSRRAVPILCYHDVDADWDSPLAVTPDAFAAQMAWLAAHRKVLPLDEAFRLIS